jgi:hypothetical protein
MHQRDDGRRNPGLSLTFAEVTNDASAHTESISLPPSYASHLVASVSADVPVRGTAA